MTESNKTTQKVQPGEFAFAAVGLAHGHINGMCKGLIEAGAELKWVWDADPEAVARFRETVPQAKAARGEAEVLEDEEVRLVAGADVPNLRCDLGLRAMDNGKDYFTDKGPMTTLDQLARARAKVAQTGRKYAVYYGERLHVEGALYAGQLVEQGRIGRVIQVINLAPHSLSAPNRPAWFFRKADAGGILCDIGSHQIEQFLYYTQAADGQVLHARVANYTCPQYPEFEDFGEATLLADNGAGHYVRVDWLTPAGLRSWGDGRLVILGSEGYIEVRKNIDVARSDRGNHVFLVNADGEQYIDACGKTGFPFFGQLLLDCLHRSEEAMTQAHAFKAAELCLKAQAFADEQRGR